MWLAATRTLLLAGGIGLVAFPTCLAVAGALDAADAVLVLVLPLAFAAAGTVAVWRRPENRAGRHLASIGAWHLVAFGLSGAAVLLDGPGGAPWGLVLAAQVAFSLGFVAYVALFAVFPDGHYERAAERWTVWAATALGIGLPVLGFFGVPDQPLPVELAPPVTGTAPLLLPALAPLGEVGPAVSLAPLVGLVLFALRYRRAGPARREPMRWPLVSVVLGVAALVAYNGLGLLGAGAGDVVFVAAFATLPVTLVIGMVRHRLLDVDLVLRRSLVYGALWLAIGAYVGVAAVLGVLAGRRFPVEVAVGITIVATLLFAPARRGLERFADRLVFGERLPRYEVLRRFGEDLEAQLDPDEIGTRLAGVAARGLDARWVRVQLVGSPPEPEVEPVVLTVPIAHDGERLGEIRCGPKRDGDYTDADRELLTTLARQAALAARTAALAADLRVRLRELVASRSRVVAAADSERRRIERDLHDGIQQALIALLAKAQLARSTLGRDPAATDRLLAELLGIARQTHTDVRELARGIMPAVLGDRGLVDAIEAQAAHLPLGVSVHSDPALRSARYPAAVELAAYFVVCEGLTNAAKHSGALDAGTGFDPERVPGSGLAGLRDRVEALGGELTVDAAPGRGTLLRAALPLHSGGTRG